LAREVDRETVEKLIKATLTAPSSKNTRSTRLAVITDRSVIERLGATRTHGTSFVSDAPLVILIMGDQAASDLWVENCAISATVLQLAAESLGLGSCWVHVNGRPHVDGQPEGMSAEEYVHSLAPQSARWRVECMVAIGYPAEEPRPRRETDDSDKVVFVE
jgi:nitroreductase